MISMFDVKSDCVWFENRTFKDNTCTKMKENGGDCPVNCLSYVSVGSLGSELHDRFGD